MTFICICSESYLNYYRELYKSLKVHSPNSKQILYFIGNNVPLEFDEVVDITEWDKNTIYNDQRISICSLRARVVLDAFEKGHEKVVFCGAKIKFFQTPYQFDLFLQHYNAVVTPHITKPLPEDGKFPSNASVSFTGHISTDLVAFKKSNDTIKFLKWQDEIMKTKCETTPQTYLDQSWLNFLPFFIHNVYILRDERYNCAYWNIAQRDLNDIVCFQFSGLDLEHPELISKYQNREVAEGKFLEFLKDYCERVK